MSRVRGNNILGSTGASLNAGEVTSTINLGSSPGVPSLASGDVFPIQVEPASGSTPSAKFEVVYLQGPYTSGSATGTVLRAQEGTTAQSHSSGVAWAHGPTALDATTALDQGAAYQSGVIGSDDLALSGLSINTSTGALTFTLAAAQECIVKDVTGLLVPVTVPAGAHTLTPTTLPTSGNSLVVGIGIDVNGQILLTSGTPLGGQLSTAAAIETNTPAAVSGRMRVADVGIYNNAGAFNFSNASTVAAQGTNWVDRRPWARGAYDFISRTANASAGNDYTTSSTSYGVIDGVNLAQRIECSGNAMRMHFRGRVSASGGTPIVQLLPFMDGATILGDGSNTPIVATPGSSDVGFFDIAHDYVPSAGSHLFAWYWKVNTGTGLIFARAAIPMTVVVEEIMRARSNNGTS